MGGGLVNMMYERNVKEQGVRQAGKKTRNYSKVPGFVSLFRQLPESRPQRAWGVTAVIGTAHMDAQCVFQSGVNMKSEKIMPSSCLDGGDTGSPKRCCLCYSWHDKPDGKHWKYTKLTLDISMHNRFQQQIKDCFKKNFKNPSAIFL